MVEKAGDIEAKANLQPPFYIRKIDSKCPKSYRPSVKKDKKDANWEYSNTASSKDNEKAKSHNLSFVNQLQAQVFKKHSES